MIAKSKFNQILANNLRRLRMAKGISQEDLSVNCGFFRTYVSLVENCHKSPSAFSVYKLAKGLKVSVSELFPKIV